MLPQALHTCCRSLIRWTAGLGAAKAGSSFDYAQAGPILEKLYAGPVSDIMHAGEIWYIQGQDPTVMDAVKDMLLRGQVHHRLFTCETLKDTVPTGILSQSDIVRLMWDHKVELEPELTKTVEDMGLCAACSPSLPVHPHSCWSLAHRISQALWPFSTPNTEPPAYTSAWTVDVTWDCVQAAAETEDASATLIQVLVDMWRDHKSCMGVTYKGDLVGNLSISDLRYMTQDLFEYLGKPVGQFLLASRGLPVPEARSHRSQNPHACAKSPPPPPLPHTVAFGRCRPHITRPLMHIPNIPFSGAHRSQSTPHAPCVVGGLSCAQHCTQARWDSLKPVSRSSGSPPPPPPLPPLSCLLVTCSSACAQTHRPQPHAPPGPPFPSQHSCAGVQVARHESSSVTLSLARRRPHAAAAQ